MYNDDDDNNYDVWGGKTEGEKTSFILAAKTCNYFVFVVVVFVLFAFFKVINKNNNNRENEKLLTTSLL